MIRSRLDGLSAGILLQAVRDWKNPRITSFGRMGLIRFFNGEWCECLAVLAGTTSAAIRHALQVPELV